MSSTRWRAAARGALLFLATSTGCAEILGTDDYAVERGPPPEGPDQGTLFYDEVCLTCLQQACPAALAECNEDSACRELFACVLACRDPGCWIDCMAPGGYDFTTNWPLADVDTCTLGPCDASCGAREGNFDCVGTYGYPQLYVSGDTIQPKLAVGQLGQFSARRYEGWLVRACQETPGGVLCDDPVASGPNGVVDLSLGVTQLGYGGFFEVTETEGAERTYVFTADGPINDFFSYDLNVDPEGVTEAAYENATGRALPSDYGVALLAFNRDCHLFEPGGMTLEAIPDDGVDIVYFFSPEEATAAFPNPIGVAGPAGDYTFVLRDRSGRETRRLTVELDPARFQVLQTLPRP